MIGINPNRPPDKPRGRKRLVIILSIAVVLVFGVILPQVSFDLPSIFYPNNNQQLWFFVSLSGLIFLLFVALTFVLGRNLLKLFAERRFGVLGSKFRTRLVVASLLLSFLPVIAMFFFAYGLMNRSLHLWFSEPVEAVRHDTESLTSLVAKYASQNSRAEALSIAARPEMQRACANHDYAAAQTELSRHELTLQGGFAVVLVDDQAQASIGMPASWPMLQSQIPAANLSSGTPIRLAGNQPEYVLSKAAIGESATVLVGIPLPQKFSESVAQVEASQQRYSDLSHERKLVRRTYMDLLLLLTVMVLFATTWLALFLSKLVTRPVVALAQAMQEISKGRLDYRVPDVPAADEIGDLVHAFNRMADELEAGRHQIDASSRELSAANSALEQRNRQIETILESIPTGVLSLDAQRNVTHVNHALLRMFHPGAGEGGTPQALIGAQLREVFPSETTEDLETLLRRADRMGTTTAQMEWVVQRVKLNVATTVATLQHQSKRLGYVLVFEDLSDLLKAQKQAAWREVARRVAHEIKNPLTPIALSADRIRRHLDRKATMDSTTPQIMRSCADTIAAAVETVRTLVDEFSTLARFPTSQPQPANVNAIVDATLGMFHGRLESIQILTFLDSNLPKVMADPEAMKRALANLVDNAAEAMSDSRVREIHISTSLVTSHDAVEISVSDTGHGVTPELKERLFLPYFSTKKRGTGLGLAIVSRIIEDHGGSIRVEENRPSGTRFVIELPVSPEAVPNVVAEHA